MGFAKGQACMDAVPNHQWPGGSPWDIQQSLLAAKARSFVIPAAIPLSKPAARLGCRTGPVGGATGC
ncbi:hypothetical protein ADIAG_01506 [Paeniglutamicibacter gangotriensis Lz1y]|uniref:Uncharacterized protein n=1 Tax=Paeniglutamicibacter gangotriensis Lz1y TaxID=1276920 RepID=M7MX29_9MICC|nr:hypothetical protein ADIAG_01506 [Paeniglutamicibacter gangotriensis Lz1y]